MATPILRRLGLFVLLLLLLPCIALTQGQTSESEPKVELTEVQKLKAENFQLKVQLAQARATIADRENRLLSLELSSEQLTLEKEFREKLNAKETDKFDWTTLTFNPPKSESK